MIRKSKAHTGAWEKVKRISVSDIHERVHLDCPFERAASYLRAHLGRHLSPDGRTAMLMMRLPVSDVAVERAVDVSLTTRLEHPIGNILDVAWHPQGGGPYPAFTGELAFHPDGNDTCWMSIDGSYEPPGGALGKAFDVAVGRRIAAAGVQTLLQDLGREIESSFREDAARAAPESPHYPPTYE